MDEDREFLRAHRDEAHEVITYYYCFTKPVKNQLS